MARDPLKVLSVVRQRAVDQQRQALAICLKAEAAAEDRIRMLDAAVVRDQALAETMPERAALLLTMSSMSSGDTPAFVARTKLSLKACSRLPRIMFCESLAWRPMPSAPQ